MSAMVQLSASARIMRYVIRAFSGLALGESERPSVSNSNPTPGEPEIALELPTPRSHFWMFAISAKNRPTSSGARRIIVLGETVFLRPVATRLSGPAPRINLRKKRPFDHSASVVTGQKLVTFLARPNKGT